MKALLVCVLLVAVFVNFSSAACQYDHVHTLNHKWSDKETYYCKYYGMKFEAGSSFRDLNRCMECHCTFDGFSCCGIGYLAGAVDVPGCVVEKDVCEQVLLNEKKTGLCHH